MHEFKTKVEVVHHFSIFFAKDVYLARRRISLIFMEENDIKHNKPKKGNSKLTKIINS